MRQRARTIEADSFPSRCLREAARGASAYRPRRPLPPSPPLAAAASGDAAQPASLCPLPLPSSHLLHFSPPPPPPQGHPFGRRRLRALPVLPPPSPGAPFLRPPPHLSPPSSAGLRDFLDLGRRGRRRSGTPRLPCAPPCRSWSPRRCILGSGACAPRHHGNPRSGPAGPDGADLLSLWHTAVVLI